MAVQIGKALRTIPAGPMPAPRLATIREAIAALKREPHDDGYGARLEQLRAALEIAERGGRNGRGMR